MRERRDAESYMFYVLGFHIKNATTKKVWNYCIRQSFVKLISFPAYTGKAYLSDMGLEYGLIFLFVF